MESWWERFGVPPTLSSQPAAPPKAPSHSFLGLYPAILGQDLPYPSFFGGAQDLLQPGAGAREAPGERLGEKQFLRMLDIIKC